MVSIESINPHLPHHFYIGVGLAVFGFRFVWPNHERVGVIITTVGLALAVDDWFTHLTGITTPIDWVDRQVYAAARRIGLVE